MKRIVASLVAFSMIFSMSIVTFADEKTDEVFLNEYDYIVSIKESSSSELAEKGITLAEANHIVAEYDRELSERALMPEEQLYGLGYSASDIQMLRKYAKSGVLTETEMRAISASCDGRITSSYMDGQEVIFKYSWTWDKSPMVVGNDAIGVEWIAYNNTTSMGVRKKSDTFKVEYYYGNTLDSTGSGSKKSIVHDNVVAYGFDVAKTTTSSTGDIVYAYAKKGYLEVDLVVPSTSTAVGGIYGHSTILGISPSLSVDASGISLSFSDTRGVDDVAPAKVHIEKGTTYRRPHVIDQL